MKVVQCYELFGGIALKNHAFSFHFNDLIERRSVYDQSDKMKTIEGQHQ